MWYRQMLTERGLSSNEIQRKVNFFIDIFVQLPMVGLMASDTIISDCGIEARTPFTRRRLVELCMSIRPSLLINREQSAYTTKYPLKRLYNRLLGERPLDKMGFAGYPNETIDYLGEMNTWKVNGIFPKLIKDAYTDRDRMWKLINIVWYLKSGIK